MNPKRWKLISTKDVSPSKWFPIEERTYELPNGKVVDDFTVSTLADVALVVPVTKTREIVMVNQFKPGVDEILIQFPGGRLENNHTRMIELAQHELEEETGIFVSPQQLVPFAKLSGFSTKASEVVYFFLAKDCEFNSQQHLDITEDIEVLTLQPATVDQLVLSNKIWCAQSVAGWELAKKKFARELGY